MDQKINIKPLGKCVIVLGMHRSGTSAVAGALSLIGVEFGSKLLPAEPFNPKGFFEHVDILNINNEILRTLNSSFEDIAPLAPEWHKSVYILPFKEKLKEIISRDFHGVLVFGFKDPRVSILMPLYLDLTREMNLDVRFVVCERPDVEIALSLKERIGFSMFQSLQLCRKYKQAIEEGVTGQSYVRVQMEEFVHNPERSIENIIEALKLPLALTDDKLALIKEFVDVGLKHHTLRAEDALLMVAEELDQSEEEKRRIESHLESIIESHLTRLHNTLAHRDHRIQFLEREIVKLSENEYEIEANQLRGTLESMRGSLSWRAVSFVQRFLDTVFPLHGYIRKPYERFLRRLQSYGNKIGNAHGKRSGKVPPFVRAPSFPPMPEGVDVLFVNHEESRTGAPKILFEVALEAKKSHSIIVISKQKGGMTSEYRTAFGERLLYPHEILKGMDRHEMARMMLQKIMPKLVYANSIVSYEYAYEARKLGIPVIMHVHEMGSAYGVAIPEELRGRFAHSADVFIAVSEAVRHDLINRMHVEEDRIRLIHEFVDSTVVRELALKHSRTEVEEMLNIEPGDLLVASMGTFDRRKGADIFVKVAKKLSGANPKSNSKIKMLWIGQRPRLHDSLLHVFDANRSAFIYIDEVKNPFPFLSRADIFFLPSREDPFPLVVLEAMALGKPVVAFRGSGGAAEAGDGSIVLVDGFDVDRAVSALKHLASDDEERQRRGEEGRKRQELFEREPLVAEIQKEIGKIIGTRRDNIDIHKS